MNNHPSKLLQRLLRAEAGHSRLTLPLAGKPVTGLLGHDPRGEGHPSYTAWPTYPPDRPRLEPSPPHDQLAQFQARIARRQKGGSTTIFFHGMKGPGQTAALEQMRCCQTRHRLSREVSTSTATRPTPMIRARSSSRRGISRGEGANK